ncbi:DUF3993 domain-containing protein [Bacillus sp. FJAT-29790]|uniref:DUF3993 domain-containing protein n=1 Tax=Bacillus sp. FJAT-29790 TaxID=1895002 RepID=UPI001C227716|nr:DUF3993 domain-containing protein [Bacillus sp. FJAT-29790]MBU8877634.1 DUF3993 domain-containing protein [Bacillus sp. FJAT-29790]
MSKHLHKLLPVVVAFILMFPSLSKADVELSNEQVVLQFLDTAFQAQVSLSEKERSMDEINELLSPYFTEDNKKQFLAENLVSENGRYLTYGTDAPLFYIPFFTFSDETKVVWTKYKIYVFEYFPENDEGPVSYESHYEGLILVKENGKWKVAEYLYDDIPKEIIRKSSEVEKGVLPKPFEENSSHAYIVQSTFQMGLFQHPVEAFFRYGISLLTSNGEKSNEKAI